MAQERANNLYRVFDGSRFAVPSAMFANNYYDGAGSDPARANCERCWLTVQPLAQRLHLTVNFDNGYPPALGGNEGAADAIRRAAQKHGAVLAAWEHVNIQFLTAALGVSKDQIPYWSDKDYDTVYVLNLTTTGALASFEVRNQSYTPRSTTCPPNFVPPGSLPMPPAPVPAGMTWECHSQRTSTNATGLRDDDLGYVGSRVGDCQNACNARRGCTALVWLAADERCRVLSEERPGGYLHAGYLASLEPDPRRSTCALVEASPPARAELVEAASDHQRASSA